MTRFFAAAAFLLSSQFICAETLDAVLARMDQAAAQFHSMSADLTMVQHTAVLDDNTTEAGTIKMQKAKSGTEALIDFTGEKDQRTLGFFDKTIQIFFPKLNLVQVYKLGKNSKFLDQYLLLGFGTSGKDLTKGYDVQLAGVEQVQGQSTSKLVLIPKAGGVKENISKAEIWIPAGSGNPVQQKFYQPSGNYRLLTYSNFQLNPSLGSLKLKTPPNAKVQYP
jgi:outer membrane lipoprotein-sorting protein